MLQKIINNTAFMRFLSLFLAVTVMFFTFSLFPMPASALTKSPSEPYIFEGMECDTYNGMPVVSKTTANLNMGSVAEMLDRYQTNAYLLLLIDCNDGYYFAGDSMVFSHDPSLLFFAIERIDSTSCKIYSHRNWGTWFEDTSNTKERVCTSADIIHFRKFGLEDAYQSKYAGLYFIPELMPKSGTRAVTMGYDTETLQFTGDYDISKNDWFDLGASFHFVLYLTDSIDSSRFTLDYDNDSNLHKGQGYAAAKGNPSVDFITTPQYDGAFGYTYVDWVAAGYQYPVFDFGINDNGNNHKYSVRLSCNSTFKDRLRDLHNEEKFKEFASTGLTFVGLVVAAKFHNLPLGALFFAVPNSNTAISESVNIILQMDMLNKLSTTSFDVKRTLSSDDMDFSKDSRPRRFSICLSDYLSIEENVMYRVEVIDNTTSGIVDTSYFASYRTYNKTASGYGTQTYYYDTEGDYETDINSNDTLHSSDHSSGGNWDLDIDSDIYPNDFGNLDLSGVNISSIFGSLQTSLSSVQQFFNSVYSIFPPTVWAIIMAGLAILIVLRILGR